MWLLLLKFWKPLAAVAILIGAGLYLHHAGYEAGHAASEAHWQPLFAQAERVRDAANSAARRKEADSKAIQSKLEAEHASQVSSILARSDAAGARIRELSLRLATASTRSCAVPQTADRAAGNASTSKIEGGAGEAGASIAAVGKDCELDAIRLEFWINRYREITALGR